MNLPTIEKWAINTIKSNDIIFEIEEKYSEYGTYTIYAPDHTRLMIVKHGGSYNALLQRFSSYGPNIRIGIVTIAPDDPKVTYILDSSSEKKHSPHVNRIIRACQERNRTCQMIKAVDFLKSSITK